MDGEAISGPGKDPWDNDRNHGWVHAYTLSDPLFDKDVLDMTYDTQSHTPLAAWDVMFGYQSSPANLRIQVFGANPPQEYNQVGPNN